MLSIDFFYPRWGAEHIDWPIFLDRVKEEGYKGIEWFPFGEKGSVDYEYVCNLLEERNLQYSIVMTVLNDQGAFDQYLELLEQQLLELSNLNAYKPLFISAQIGREYYNIDQISRCISVCDKVENLLGVPIYHETHRNKWNYGLHKIGPVLDLFPNLKLTLDISHWFCVSESFLENQQDSLKRALERVFHIHTRIGSTQTSQVHDVASPIYYNAVLEHLKVWQSYINMKRTFGIHNFTMTTEFGPPPYLISSGSKEKDYEEQWRQNLWIKSFLVQNLK